MKANLVERPENRYRHINSTLSETAQTIRQTKEMLNRPSQQLFQCERTMMINPQSSSKVQLNVTCHITLRQSQNSSKSSLYRREATTIQETPFKLPSTLGYHPISKTIEPSFSFGKLKSPVIGRNGESSPESQDLYENASSRKRINQNLQIPLKNKEQTEEKITEHLFSETYNSTRKKYQNDSYLSNNHQYPLVRDSAYRIQPTSKPTTILSNDNIKIQDQASEWQEEPSKSPLVVQHTPKSSKTTYTRVMTEATVSVHETPKRFTKHRIDRSNRKGQVSTDHKFKSIRDRLKTEMSKSMELRKSTESSMKDKDRIDNRSRHSHSRSQSPRANQIQNAMYPATRRTINCHSSCQSIFTPSQDMYVGRIECPKFKRQIEKSIRVQFLSQFSYLYTQKRINYEELFNLYYECRVKNIPDYRWAEHIHQWLRQKHRRTTLKI